ncbi:MAG: nicotinamide-nucleotide adenylyltransferase [Methanosarcinales archaeon]
MERVCRGLYIGRFQPYHMGHSQVLEVIAGSVDEVIIGIGSAQRSHQKSDPFTAGERVLMVSRAVEELGIKTYIIPIEDVHRNSLWVSHVKSLTPPFEVVYSNNPLVKELFREAGIEVVETPLFNRERYSGKRIRRLMLSDDEGWKDLVPTSVLRVIDEIDGVGRLRRISGSDDLRVVHSEVSEMRP